MQEASRFFFPQRANLLDDIATIEQLRQWLKSEAKANGNLWQNIKYCISIHKNRYVYAKCVVKRCPACIRYRLESGRLKLSTTKCEHIHHSKTVSTRYFKFKAVAQYMSELSSTVPIAALKRVICPQFAISEKQFYYILGKIRSKPLTTAELIHRLEEEKYQVFASREERNSSQPPEMLIITSKQMKENFRTWGEVLSFDLTFNLVKNVNASGAKWKVGYFIALNAARQIMPVALVATLNTTKQVYVQLLRTLFQTLEATPKVLVSDEQKAFLAAVQQLKDTGQFEGKHLLDGYHIIHNVRKRLTNKEDIVLFSKILHARNNGQFEMLVEKTRSRLALADLPLLDRFLARSKLYCFSQIQPVYFGFSASTSPNQSLHSLLKRIQPQQKDYSITIRNCLKCTEQMMKIGRQVSIQLTPLESIFAIPQLRILRMMVCKQVMIKFTQQLAHSMRLDVLEVEELKIMVREYKCVFQVKWEATESTEQRSKWTCNCGYELKTRLPCRHQLRVILSKNENLLPYIPRKWMLTPQKVDQISANVRCKNSLKEKHLSKNKRVLGRQKNSRRRFPS